MMRHRHEGRAVCAVLIVFSMTFLITIVPHSRASQFPVADEVAQLLIAKYQNTSCEDLKKPAQPPSGQQAAKRQWR